MNFTRDLHLCGICKRIFSDLNFFHEHKTQCVQSNIAFSPNPHDISLENGLFCNETVLDLTVLDSGFFLPILHCENEEVVSGTIEVQSQEADGPGQVNLKLASSNENSESLESLTSDEVSKNINEEDVANLLVTQLSKEFVSKSITELNKVSTSPQNKQAHAVTAVNTEAGSRKGPFREESEKQKSTDKKVAANQNYKNICKICNYVSVYHRDLIRHMRKHTGEKPYECPECGKKFARQDKLTTHKRIHAGDKRYKCQSCDYASTDSGALQKHLQIHTDDRPHKCQMCSYRARNASHMTVHLRTHTGDSPFFCCFETCRKTFKTSTDLKRHEKVHKVDLLSPSYSAYDEGADNKFSCKHSLKKGKLFMKTPNCHLCQDFAHLGTVKKKRVVGRKRSALVMCIQQHKCSHCRATFVRPDSLRSHVKLHNQNTLSPNGLHGILEDEAMSKSTNSQEHSSIPRENSTLLYLISSELQDSFASLNQDASVIDSPFL